jgi:hypothetical protein
VRDNTGPDAQFPVHTVAAKTPLRHPKSHTRSPNSTPTLDEGDSLWWGVGRCVKM